MAGLPLLDLNPTFLEKVINKTQETSYFRLQQTCRAVNEFIRSCPNISVHLPGYFCLRNSQERGSYWFYAAKYGGIIEVDALYGTRLWVIDTVYLETGTVDPICNSLMRNGILCKELFLYKNEFTVEDCKMLLNSLQPISAVLNGEGPYQVEELLQSQSLKNVEVRLDPSDTIRVLPQFLSHFEEVTIRMGDSNGQLDMLHTVLQILFAQPLNPNLREFLFIVEWGNLPTVEELEKRLDYHKLMILCTTSDDLIFTVDLPDHFPSRAHFCVTIINGNYAEISYRREIFDETLCDVGTVKHENPLIRAYVDLDAIPLLFPPRSFCVFTVNKKNLTAEIIYGQQEEESFLPRGRSALIFLPPKQPAAVAVNLCRLQLVLLLVRRRAAVTKDRIPSLKPDWSTPASDFYQQKKQQHQRLWMWAPSPRRLAHLGEYRPTTSPSRCSSSRTRAATRDKRPPSRDMR